MIKVGAVQYFNTKPLLYGIKNGSALHNIKLDDHYSIELVEDYPSRIAGLLLTGEIDH